MGHDDDAVLLARARSLHDRLCAALADHALWAEAAELFDRRLIDRLSSRPAFRRTDPQTIADGVTDAILEYVEKPQAFDPSHGRRLDRHLELAAKRNVLNAFRGETRRRAREHEAAARKAGRDAESVELDSPAGKVLSDEDAKRLARDRERLFALLPDPIDRRILELKLAGETKTSVFAAAMGLAHLPAAEQTLAVKRAKGRIDKVLRRAIRPDPPETGRGDDAD